jgi:hypothetical protein
MWYVAVHVSVSPANNPTEHMRDMFEKARKQTLASYQAILRNVHEKPSVIAQTYNSVSDGRPVVSLRPLYLCIQCPSIMTETDRDEHLDTKAHCFSELTKAMSQQDKTDHVQRLSRGKGMYIVPTARILFTTLS